MDSQCFLTGIRRLKNGLVGFNFIFMHIGKIYKQLKEQYFKQQLKIKMSESSSLARPVSIYFCHTSGNSVSKNSGNNKSLHKRSQSSYRVKPEELSALKERVKLRNQNKQNNPMFKSENIWLSNSIEKPIEQPIKKNMKIPMTLNNFSINDFQIGDLLGKGAQAKVRIGFHKITGAVFSIKTLLRQKVEKKLDIFIRSLKIQMFLDHPNIAKIYGVIVDQKYIHLVMEYCADGDLTMNKNLFGKQHKNVKTIVYKISSALQHLHNSRIQHRDLKLQNILLSYGVPKLTDFQLSVYTRLDFFPRKTICGSPAYFCPQMIEKQRYNKKADIWCLGIVFYQLLCGYFPFQINKIQDLQNITNKQIKQFPRTLSRMARELITKMLNKDSQNRISIQEVVEHEFFGSQTKEEKEVKSPKDS